VFVSKNYRPNGNLALSKKKNKKTKKQKKTKKLSLDKNSNCSVKY
jgi:hypothetical protein